jgi:dephospho-CoA kinase
MRPYCVGLTGGIGSGKSTVANCFAGLGVKVLDADQEARGLTAAGGAAMKDILQVFGSDYLLADGALNRGAMRDRVFADAEARLQLERILHPLIRDRLQAGLESTDGAAAGGGYVLLVVPLLQEHWADYAAWVDRVLVVDCAESRQLERLMARSHLTRPQAESMLKAQASRAERLALAQDVIDNNGDKSLLLPWVSALHERYLLLAREKTASQAGISLP